MSSSDPTRVKSHYIPVYTTILRQLNADQESLGGDMHKACPGRYATRDLMVPGSTSVSVAVV